MQLNLFESVPATVPKTVSGDGGFFVVGLICLEGFFLFKVKNAWLEHSSLNT